MALVRPFTMREAVRLLLLGVQIGREIDAELGELVCRLARGDDSALPAIHDRCNVTGRPEIADGIRRLVRE